MDGTGKGAAGPKLGPGWDLLLYQEREKTNCLPSGPCVRQGELPKWTLKGHPSQHCNRETEVTHS